MSSINLLKIYQNSHVIIQQKMMKKEVSYLNNAKAERNLNARQTFNRCVKNIKISNRHKNKCTLY